MENMERFTPLYALKCNNTLYALFNKNESRGSNIYAYKGILNQPPSMNKVYTPSHTPS